MVSQRAISFEADLDISDVMRGLNRIERQARSVGGTVGRVGGGLGRAGGGIGRTVGAGAGIGAGAAVFEMLIQRIFELFEDTPVLEQFTTALDGIFKAAGPLIGVLLESLTPVIVALTPAITPLARALTPLVKLMGTGLLVAVELLTPGIALLAEGLGYATRTIQTVVLSGIRFVVDQLNRLPFVDIQANLDVTGGSFDAMALQIQNAGDAAGIGAGTAEGNFRALTGSTMGVGSAAAAAAVPLGILQQRELDAASATELLRLSVIMNTDATSFQQQANMRAAEAAEAAAEAAEASADLWARVAEENAAAADRIVTSFDLVNQEMDEMYTASNAVGLAMAQAVQPIEEAGEAIEAAGMAAARGAAAAARAGASASSSGGRPGQTSTVTIGPNGELIYNETYTPPPGVGGPSSSGPGQTLYTDAAGNVFYDPGLQNPASGEAQGLADSLASSINVNVQIGDETVQAVTEISDNRRGSE